MSYYGLSLNSGSLGGDIFINFMLGGLVKFPAYTVCFLCYLVGRKPLHIVGMMIGGFACLGTVFVDLYVRGGKYKKNFTFKMYSMAKNICFLWFNRCSIFVFCIVQNRFSEKPGIFMPIT